MTVLLHALHYARSISTDRPLTILEIGCMSSLTQGQSTLVCAKFLRDHPPLGRFITIDSEKMNIDQCRSIFAEIAQDLAPFVTFRVGDTTQILSEVVAELGEIDVAFLDGSGHPEVCLLEFETVLKALAPKGVIIVDDANPQPLTKPFPHPRVFGKASLILSWLLISDYIHAVQKNHGIALADRDPQNRGADFFESTRDHIPLAWMTDRSFRVRQQNNKHGLLVFGPTEYIADVDHESLNPEPPKARTRVKRFLKKALSQPGRLFVGRTSPSTVDPARALDQK